MVGFSLHVLAILLGGFAAQFVDGVLGMGYGVSLSSLLLALGLQPALVSPSVHTAEIFTSLASGLSHSKLGNVDWGLTAPLALSGVAGGVSGDREKAFSPFLDTGGPSGYPGAVASTTDIRFDIKTRTRNL